MGGWCRRGGGGGFEVLQEFAKINKVLRVL